MAIITSNEIIFDENSRSFGILKDHLVEVEKKSTQEYRNHKSVLRACLNFINKPVASINMLDIRDFLEEDIDKREIVLETKETYRSILKSFFDYFARIELAENRITYNPVPNSRVFGFTVKEGDYKKQSEMEGECYSKEEIREMIIKSRKIGKNDRTFIFLSIITLTGMRPAECITIRIENINLKERFIETGFYKNARKSKKGLLFFIPKRFVPFLENYILDLERESGWLFAGKRNGNHLDLDGNRSYIKKYYGYYIKYKYLRRSIITERGIKGCPRHINEILNNHTPTSVQGKHYDKKPLEVKRTDYDKFYPYADLDLPYF